MPHREVIDGVLVIFGGAFLITPGFITDIVGRAPAPAADAVADPRAWSCAGSAGAWRAARCPLRPPGAARLRRRGQRARVRRLAPAQARAVSAPALALSFFDAAHDIHGTARSGMSILFEGRRPTALPEGPEVESTAGGWRAVLGDTLSLEFETVSPSADLGGVRAHVARVRGEAAGRRVDGLGTVSETEVPPQWEELDAVRGITALVDEQHALVALARRPRGAVGHGDEEVVARLVEDDAAPRGRGRPHLDRLRRRRPPAQRRARAVAARRGLSAPRLGPGDRRLVARPRRAPGARRGLPLATRRPRGHRLLRADAAHGATRGRVRDVLICDFGGVLTTPLQEGFLAYQEEAGVSLEELGTAMARATEEHGDHPLFMLERGEITETEFWARLERHVGTPLRPRPPARALLRAARAEPADDRARARAARPTASAPRCSRTTCASGSRCGEGSSPRSTSCSR